MAKRLLKRISKTAKQRRRLEKLLRARKRRDAKPSYDTLEAKQLLALGVGANDCAPDLVLSQVATQTVEVGQTLSFNIFSAGGTVTDVDASGSPTSDNIRVQLDPDVPEDAPVGASITEAGVFTWTPTQDQIGTFEIIVIAVDQGTPPLADAETFTVEVTASSGGNVAPVVDLNGTSSGTGFASTFTEDAGAVSIVDTNTLVTDSDNTTLASTSIILSNRPDGDAESLSVDVGSTSISGSYDSITGRLELTGSDTLANYRQVISTLRYNNTSQAPDTTDRVVTVTVNDGTEDSPTSTATVTIEAVNDAPDLAAISDQNATVGQLLEVTISATDPENDGLTFQFDPQATGIPASATLTPNGNSATISWTPSASDGIGPFTFAVLVTDDDASNPLSDLETYTVTLVSDPPVIDLNGNDPDTGFVATFTEDAGPVLLVDPELTVTDPNDANLQSASVSITNLQDGAFEFLGVNDALGPNITATYDATTGTLSLTGEDTLANYQAVLRTLTYVNTSQAPTVGDREIDIAVNDGTNTSISARSAVSVVAQNDSPNLTLPSPFNNSSTPIPRQVGQPITFNATAVDPDDDTTIFILDLDNSGLPEDAAQPSISNSGAFAWTPDALGTFEIGIIAIDSEGASDVEFFTIQVTEVSSAFASITDISPANGDELVASTSVATINFDSPVDPTTVTAESFFATASGQQLDGSIFVSSTGMFARLNFENELPGSTQISVFANGDLITDLAGNPIDGNGDNQAGGMGGATFSTVPDVGIQGSSVSGRVIASEPDSSGNDVPLGGVTIRVEGAPELNVVTDSNGEFTLVNVPAPNFFVSIDGSTTTLESGNPLSDGGFYPDIGELFESVPGQEISLDFNIHLPFILDEAIHEIVPGEEITIGLPQQQITDDPVFADVRLTVPANSLVLPDGSLADEVGIFRVDSDRLPAPLPPTLNHAFDVTIQAPDGAFFDVPAPVTFPNVDGAAPGEQRLLMSFDHASGEWIVVGTLTAVDEDGDGVAEVVVSDEGSGVLEPGWHGAQNGSPSNGGGEGEGEGEGEG